MPIQAFGLSKRRRDIFSQLISQLTGVPAYWANEPNAQFDPETKAKITLRVRGVTSWSEWDKITTDSGTATNTQLGAQRVADVEVLVESMDPDIQAHELYYMLTTRIYRDRFRAILHNANMAVGTNADALDLPSKYDDHIYSACAGSLRLAFADMDPLTDQLDTWIQTVNGNNVIVGSFTGG